MSPAQKWQDLFNALKSGSGGSKRQHFGLDVSVVYFSEIFCCHLTTMMPLILGMQEEVQRSLAQKQEQEAAVQLLQSKLVSASTRLEGMENVLASQQQESMAAAEAREEAAKKAKALEVIEMSSKLSSWMMAAAPSKLLDMHVLCSLRHHMAPVSTSATQI